MSGASLAPPQEGRVDAIAEYLTAHLQPGDTVQPLDWTWGAVHAMLIARARIATPYVHDMHFYRTVSEPYIQSLRRDFIADLDAARPRYVIQVIAESKPWLTGPDTTRSFPQLTEFLDVNYTVAVRDDQYLIWERK
jgi:hypothetical protein